MPPVTVHGGEGWTTAGTAIRIPFDPDHLREDRIELLSTLADLALFWVLALLYRRES